MHRARSRRLQLLKLKKCDLLSIWSLLVKYHSAELAAAQAQQQAQPYVRMPDPPTVTVTSEGGMSTEDNSGAIFENDVIDNMKSTSVDFRYSFFPVATSIQVRLAEGDSGYTNSFSVSG